MFSCIVPVFISGSIMPLARANQTPFWDKCFGQILGSELLLLRENILF